MGRSKREKAVSMVVKFRQAEATPTQAASWRALWTRLLTEPEGSTLASEQSGEAKPEMARKEER